MNKTATLQALRMVMFIALGVGAVFLWFYSQRPNTLPIKTVRVEGNFTHLSKSMLAQAAMPYVHTGFFALDAVALRDHLLAMPWVAAVNVTRVWPDTVSLEIKETKPVAIWRDNGVVDAEGNIFYPPLKTMPHNLPHFIGTPAQAKEILANYVDFQQQLSKIGVQITELAVTPRSSWSAQLSNQIILELGREEMSDRIGRFVRSYQQIFGSNGTAVEKVDLRYSNGIAVKWKHS